MICIKCGRQLPEDAIFCAYCGASVENDIAEEAVPAEHESSGPFTENASTIPDYVEEAQLKESKVEREISIFFDQWERENGDSVSPFAEWEIANDAGMDTPVRPVSTARRSMENAGATAKSVSSPATVKVEPVSVKSRADYRERQRNKSIRTLIGVVAALATVAVILFLVLIIKSIHPAGKDTAAVETVVPLVENTSTPVPTAYIRTGWQTINGNRYYYDENGTALRGRQIIDGQAYSFDDTGKLRTGAFTLDDENYCADETGVLQSGWYGDGVNRRYYDLDSFAMVRGGRYTIDGDTYFFAEDGSVAVGRQTIEKDDGTSAVYYYSETGIEQEGWVTDGVEKYWYGPELATGWQIIEGKRYCFDEQTGALLRNGWYKLDEIWYYLQEDGVPMTGWQTIDGETYYFMEDGAMASAKWISTDGRDGTKLWYYYLTDGTEAKGWEKINGIWYYFDPDNGNVMVTGWKTIKEKEFYFDESGAMADDWFKLDGVWYYADSNGYVQDGWLNDNGKTYYLDNRVMVTGWQFIDGKTYYFASGGARQTGWQQIDGAWYYFDPEMYYGGQFVIDGKIHEFDASGVWLGEIVPEPEPVDVG